MNRPQQPTNFTANRRFAVRGRYLFPCDSAPLRDACLTIDNGRIVAVGPAEDTNVIDLGQVAVLPGLVNAHTHLEFSQLGAPLGTNGIAFPDWIRHVIAWRNTQNAATASDETWQEAIRAGIRESQLSGITTVGEIATRPESAIDGYANFNGIAFLELLGFREALHDALMSAAERFTRRGGLSPGVRVGLSPHAPYTVSPTLLKRVVQLSARERVPVAMHLAETRDEIELLRNAGGPLLELLEELGAWQPGVIPLGTRPQQYLDSLASAERSLVIHGNYLVRDEIDFVAQRRDRMSIVYCPRTHAYFGHDAYPLAEMRQAGVRVVLGTDSRASNPDLNVFEDMKAVAQAHPWLGPAELLQMVTIEAAIALGVEDRKGSLTIGKDADFLALPIDSDTPSDPHDLILGGKTPPSIVFQSGLQIVGGI